MIKKSAPAQPSGEIAKPASPWDTTDLAQKADLIFKAKRQWERTFDAIVDPLSIVDARYQVRRANIAFSDRSGLKVTEVPGRYCHEVLFRRSTPCSGCPLKKTLAGNSKESTEITRAEDSRVFKVWVFPYSDGPDGVPLAVCHYQDVTEEKALLRQALQAEKMAAVGQLAGGVAHEINNPLSGILAFTQIMRRETAADDPRAEYLENIEQSALRCKRIVESLLNFSRAPKAAERKPVSLNRVVEEALFLVRHPLQTKQLTLKTELDEALPEVPGYANELEQVLLNLLTNAIAATPVGGEITVSSALRNRREVALRVKDTGAGINAKHLGKIFEPFFTTKPEGEGTGLGLAISYRIVTEHGGRIDVKSEQGKGAEFEVVLPVKRTD